MKQSENEIDNYYSSPLVSIGLPVYNGEKYLQRALDSLISQEYKNFEIIISDNGSTDSSLEICRKYSEVDKRIKLNENQSNIGSFLNFLITLNKNSGKYFMFAADDDFWAPQYLKIMVEQLELHPESNLVRCASDRINEDGTFRDTIRFFDDKNLNSFNQLNLAFRAVTTENVCYFIYGLYRSDYLKSIFNKKIPQVFGSDLIFMVHVFMSCRVRYVDQVLSTIQLHEKHTSERYHDEDLGRFYGDRFRYTKMAIQLGPYLFHSSILPWHRKTWIPILVTKQMIWALYHDFWTMGVFFIMPIREFFRRI